MPGLMLHVACPEQAALDAHVQRHHGCAVDPVRHASVLLPVGNAAEAYVLAAARTRTKVPRASAKTTAAEAGHVHQ